MQLCRAALGSGARGRSCSGSAAGNTAPPALLVTTAQPVRSLRHLSPVFSQVSKATTLQKTVEYICKLQHERAALQDEAQRLREQIEELNSSIK